CEVVHNVRAINHFCQYRLIVDRVDGVAKVRGGLEMFNVANTASRKIIDDFDQTPRTQQLFREMRANKAGASRDQCSTDHSQFPNSANMRPRTTSWLRYSRAMSLAARQCFS